MKIRTEFVYPPIPDRRFDWSAVDDDSYEGGSPIGYGETREEAIADLLIQIEDDLDAQVARIEKRLEILK